MKSTIFKFGSYLGTMNIKLSYVLLLFSAIMVFNSCAKEDLVETDEDLIPYFELFAEEAALRGFVVNYEAERIEGLLQDIPDVSIQGQCFHNEKKPKKVIIDIDYWDRASKFEKEFIIFHELGHCFLNRDHLDDANVDGSCVSIMHSNPGVCNFNLNSENREEYLDELFFQ